MAQNGSQRAILGGHFGPLFEGAERIPVENPMKMDQFWKRALKKGPKMGHI